MRVDSPHPSLARATSNVGLLVFLLATACGSQEGGSTNGDGATTGGAGGHDPTGGAAGADADSGSKATGGTGTTGGAGGGKTGGGGAESHCDEGATRAGDTTCGLNDRGALEEVCDDGAWVDGTTCQDSDECVDGQSRNSPTTCGTNGVLVETCESGKWTETSDCNETTECSGSGTRPGETSCGLNGRGTLEQECAGGFWIDTTTCSDPDECTDGSTNTESCLGGAGTLERSCVGGAWVGECALTSILRSSVDSAETEGNGASRAPSISSDGRYVAFDSEATNLVSGDTNAEIDVFVRDLVEGTTRRVSVSSDGAQGNQRSTGPSISADGRYVAFRSKATNLVADDTNAVDDIFVRDLLNGTTQRVSLGVSGQANGFSTDLSISADGRYVAFASEATNLVNDDTSSRVDIFVRDLVEGTTQRASVDTAGTEANGGSYSPSVSNTGVVVFHSTASNLVSGDTNGAQDIFARDLVLHTTRRVSLNGAGTQVNKDSARPKISANGRYVAFATIADISGDTNSAWDVYVRDLVALTTQRASVSDTEAQGNGASDIPTISADCRYVAFVSTSSNLVSGDTNSTYDVFVRDLQAGTTKRVSADATGAEGNDGSFAPVISANGRAVAFPATATNLVDGDANGVQDIFIAPRP